MSNQSIFNKYYTPEDFVDRFRSEKEEAVDVIIPLLNTNELWERNLYSFYREIPINRLLIGDGGCTDDSIEIVKKFPRVIVIDQSKYKSQGYCIKELMEYVETEWFVYLHADVYLPEKWYDEMVKNQKDYDWFECYRKLTTLIEFWSEEQHKAERAFSGSQMGRTAAFKNVLPKIDDDYLQRNEDIIFAELIQEEGFKYGRVSNTFHYHQVMNRRGEKEPKFKRVDVIKERDKEWEIKIYTMQVRGIIKYLRPKKYLVRIVNSCIAGLLNYNALDWKEFKEWVKNTNREWLNYVSRKIYILTRIKERIKKIIKWWLRPYFL